jgi:hypothetical protein
MNSREKVKKQGADKFEQLVETGMMIEDNNYE